MVNFTFSATDKAVNSIRSKLEKRGTPESMLRIGIVGGKCSGYAYHMDFFDDKPKETDLVFTFEDVSIVIDKKSIIYLNGTELDWEKRVIREGFVFNNPNVKSVCGCNESFSVA